MAHLEPPERMVPTVVMELPELLENLAHLEMPLPSHKPCWLLLVLNVHATVPLAQMDPPAPKVPMEALEMTEPPAKMEIYQRPESQDPLDPKDHPDPTETREVTEPVENSNQDPKEHPEPQEPQANQVLPEVPDPREKMERVETTESPESLEAPEDLVNPEPQEELEPKETTANQDPPVLATSAHLPVLPPDIKRENLVENRIIVVITFVMSIKFHHEIFRLSKNKTSRK